LSPEVIISVNKLQLQSTIFVSQSHYTLSTRQSDVTHHNILFINVNSTYIKQK